MIVTVAVRGKGVESGLEMELTYFEVVELRDGLVVRRRIFPTREEALEAAGLEKGT